MKKPGIESIAIALILLIAALLRFWRIWDLQYSYDELSAILRANTTSWHEHIRTGVSPDGHPALVQTLIWLIGDHVTLLKCIAASFGTAAVYFTYRAGKSAFNPAAGIAAAAMMAVLYMPVFWSQQVRPYAFGMCFSTALLWTFAQLAFENKDRSIHYIRFAILAALCAYTHYFAGLFAAILFTSLLVLNKKTRKKVLLSASVSILLFLPHISISMRQLAEGGLGWLGKPSAAFFLHHLFEIFDNSLYLICISAIFLIAGLVVIWRSNSQILWKKIITLCILFFSPILIGFIYSISRSPVLQHSVLVFSLPAFLILVGYICSHTSLKIFYMQLMLIILCAITILIHGKRHYSLGYKEAWSSAVRYMKQHPDQAYAVNAPKDIFGYYVQKFNLSKSVKFHYVFAEGESVTLKKVLWYADSFRGKFILSSGTDPAFIGIYEEISCNYKQAESETSWVGAEIPEFRYMGCIGSDFRTNGIPTRFFPHPWTGESIQIAFDTLSPAPNDAIIICYTPDSSAQPTGEIQTALFNGDRIIDWRSTPLLPAPTSLKGLFYHTIKLADIPLWCYKTRLVLRLESPFRSGRFRVRISKGNPYLYGVN